MLSEIIKFADRLAGSILVSLLGGLDIRQEGSVDSILVIRPGGIGDAVLMFPMLQRLSTIYPDATIEVLAERRNAQVFGWSPVVSSVWCYDKPSEFVKLFTRKFDLIIDTEQWYRLSAVVARLLHPSRLIGFSTNERSRLLSDPCPYKQDEYEAAMFMVLLAPLELRGIVEALDAAYKPFVLSKTAYDLKNPYVVIFPGASVAAKQWPAERFTEVARYCETHGFEVVVVGGRGEQDAARAIAGISPHCRNLAGKTSLAESASIVAGAALMISGDTGLLHVAQSSEVPTVALFGPSNPKKWSRASKRSVVVSAGTECAPCSRFGTIPRCPHRYKCMQNITVTMVIEAINGLLPKIKGDHC